MNPSVVPTDAYIDASQMQFGQDPPERHVPFISTRELFTLRVGVAPSITAEDGAATVNRRCKVVAELAKITT